MKRIGGNRLSAAVIVGVVVAVGTVLVMATRSGSRPSDLVLAILSGGLVGGSLILLETMLGQAADARSEQTALRMQLSSTVELNGIDLRARDLADYYLPGRNLVAAKLCGTRLEGAVLIFGDLRHADLSGADLRNADLSGSTLRFADLSGAILAGAILNDTDLRDANLEGADLSGALLMRVRAHRSKFADANLTGAIVREVGLDGADLGDARGLMDTCLERVHWDARTVWPTDIDPPEVVEQQEHELGAMGIAEYLVWRREGNR